MWYGMGYGMVQCYIHVMLETRIKCTYMEVEHEFPGKYKIIMNFWKVLYSSIEISLPWELVLVCLRLIS